MCKMMEDLRNESKAEGVQEGTFKGKAELILKYMKKHECDAESAMDDLDVSTADRVVIRPMLATA